MSNLSVKVLSVPVVIFLVGIALSYLLVDQINKQLKFERYLKLENIAKQVSIRFQDAIDLSLNDLQALQAFYSSNVDKFSVTEFDHYMDIIDVESSDHIQALSWVPLVKLNERQSFEQLIQKDIPNFTITARNETKQLVASSDKPYFTPVTFIRPYQANKAAQGFDLSSNSTRRVSLEYASQSGEMTATAKITLVQEKKDSYGFLIIAPVYQSSATVAEQATEDNTLLGFVTGVFRVNNLMKNAKLQADNEGLKLNLFDVDQVTGGRLYGSEEQAATFKFNINIPDRQWRLDVSLSQSLLEDINRPAMTYWVMAGGAVISFLIALCLYALQVAIARSGQISQLSELLKSQNDDLELTVKARTEAVEHKNRLLNIHVDELARSNKDLDDFAYVASHDLKAPLRGIDQLAKWTLEDVEESNLTDVTENLTLLRSRVHRLETLLDDLLMYSRANKQEHSVSTINSKALIEDTFLLMSPPSHFSLFVNGDMPIFTTAKSPFSQVMRNLLHNSLKHHDKGKDKIEVSCSEDEQFYKFSVKDNGPGIPDKHHEHIFKMFTTLKPRDEVEGSGMGLALINKIVQHYKGKVHLSSTLGQGCTFTFTWPKAIDISEYDVNETAAILV